jgi:hypothetical protein
MGVEEKSLAVSPEVAPEPSRAVWLHTYARDLSANHPAQATKRASRENKPQWENAVPLKSKAAGKSVQDPSVSLHIQATNCPALKILDVPQRSPYHFTISKGVSGS